MSKKKYEELINNINNDKYHLYFKGDRENFLQELKFLYEDEITKQEYEDIITYVEEITEEIPDCIWEAMIECDSDLAE